jgi:hypothetical protein
MPRSATFNIKTFKRMKHRKNTIKSIFYGIAAAASLQGMAFSQNVLNNASFENTPINVAPYNSPYHASTNPSGFTNDFGGNIRLYLETANQLEWFTTASDAKIEIWRNGQGAIPGLIAPDGNQWAEINATQNAALIQEVTITGAGLVDLGFYHRGRAGNDTVAVKVTYLGLDNTFGTFDDILAFSQSYTTGNSAWALYAEQDVFTSIDGGKYRFSYEAVSTASGSPSIGNFIDAPYFGVDAIPEASSSLLGLIAGAMFLRRRR